MITIKYTGTTKGFEHYYGEILSDGKVITEYYYRPSRYRGVYKTRKLFKGEQLADRFLLELCKKIGNYL